MFKTTKKTLQTVAQDIVDTIRRYPPRALALIVTIELIWAASVLVPVLLILSTMIGFSKHWTAIVPGLTGLISFLFFLGIGAFIAYQPSLYVARWREKLIANIARRHPALSRRTIPTRREFALPPDVQDAD